MPAAPANSPGEDRRSLQPLVHLQPIRDAGFDAGGGDACDGDKEEVIDVARLQTSSIERCGHDLAPAPAPHKSTRRRILERSRVAYSVIGGPDDARRLDVTLQLIEPVGVVVLARPERFQRLPQYSCSTRFGGTTFATDAIRGSRCALVWSGTGGMARAWVDGDAQKPQRFPAIALARMRNDVGRLRAAPEALAEEQEFAFGHLQRHAERRHRLRRFQGARAPQPQRLLPAQLAARGAWKSPGASIHGLGPYPVR